jgi:phospholipid/cholesterol/gamma-HCH transport system substrate-binding protein
MKNTLETRLGLFVFLILLAGFILINSIGGLNKWRPGKHINALFGNAQDLKLGASVKMAGVEIGRVESISLETNKVKVVMKLHPDAIVKTDSSATIKFTGLMGQNYVAVDFGSPGAPDATEGTYLNTAEQPDLSAIMAKLDNVASGIENLTKSFSGEKIDNLLGPFTDFLKQNAPHLTATIANIQAVSGQIAAGKGTVGRLINDDTLYVSALDTVSNLQSAVADARVTLGAINAGQGSLGHLMKDDTLYNETTASMTNLKEILQKINQGKGTVGKIVNDDEFYRNARLTLEKVDKATDSLEDSGPLTVIGTLAGNLF